MTHVQQIKNLSNTYTQKIISFLNENNLESIEFINPIIIMVDTNNNENSKNNIIPCITQFIDKDGIVAGIDNMNNEVDWKLSDMSVEELAYILDIIINQDYYEYADDEEFELFKK